jgi:tryptophanyl-tRNA synthetase
MEQPKQLEGTVLGQLMQAVNPDAYKDYVAYGATPGVGYGDLMKKLLTEITTRFAPYQEKFRHYQAHPQEVEAVLADGATRARELALPIIEKARQATGLAK